MIETSFTRTFGLQAPVVEAPVAAAPTLVAAVSNAGGLGLLPITWLDTEAIRAAVRAIKKLTSRPFGINLVLDEPRDERLEAALEEGASVVTFFWGDPAPYIERVHTAGALATLTVGSAEEARRAAAAGVDAVVAQGWEAGGHVWGRVATLPLVPAVKSAVAPLPVVAAGGISDGRGLAAVLALGADAAWLGTRFVVSEEAPFTPEYKERVIAASETEAIYTTLFDVGWPNAPHRVLPNSTVAAWEAAGRPESGARPGEGEIIATAADGEEIPRYGVSEPIADMSGDLEALALYAGQSAGSIDRIRPAGAIVKELVEEAEAILRSLAGAGESAS
ncbi:MAG TPA: nitronate monooxygenase [Solirubrobacteraceae bacterium]|nr:nitronate monooxygenase [Solirubrobacteraceae bacterium]